MKRFKAFAIALAMGIFLVTGAAIAQEKTAPGGERKSSIKEGKSSIKTDTRRGTPIHTETRDGIRVDVWLVTHEMHRGSEAPKDKSAVDSHPDDLSRDDLYRKEMERNPNKKDMEGKTSGEGKTSTDRATPEVAVVKISEVGTNAPIKNAKVDLKVTSPSGKPSTVVLDYSKDEYVKSVQMNEKGTYEFELKVNRDGKTTSIHFTRSVPAS